MRRASLLIATMLIVGCKGGSFDVGSGAETDGRLTSDVYTWDCTSEDGDWMGVFGFDVTLEWVPDAIYDRSLPSPGQCTQGLSMFALDAGYSGDDIPDAKSNPRWRTAADSGRFDEVWSGLWRDEVDANVMGCGPVEDTIVDGVEIYDAGVMNGARTPQAGDVALVEINGESTSEFETGFEFGEEIDVTWEASGWDETFVQVRRVKDWVAYDSVICNTTGEDGFVVDDEVWGMLNEELNVDYNYLYVAFQNTEQWESEYGQKVDVTTRGLHVAGVLDLDDAR